MPGTTNPAPPIASRVERIFPTLTSAQVARIWAHGRVRQMRPAEVLVGQGDSGVPFFLVKAGELEIVQSSGPTEILVTKHGPGQFTAEVNMMSGRRSLVRMRATQPGELIELSREQMLALVKADSELREILLRAFILRRVEL